MGRKGKNIEQESQLVQKIQPVITTKVAQGEPNGFKAKPGHYHLVKMDANGQEIPGTDVSVSAALYQKTFSVLSNYKVKKSPK